MRYSSLVALSLIALASVAVAQPGERRGPPPEAVQACADQEAATRCAFDGRRGVVEGVCRVVPDGQLACVPEGGPPPR